LLRVELHTHSIASDGALEPKEILSVAAARGCTGVAITDHDTFRGAKMALESADIRGTIVIPGIEVRSVWGDILVLCDSIPDVIPPRDPWELREWAEGYSCLVIPTHPLHPVRSSVGERRLREGASLWDAVEVWNPRGPPWSNWRAERVAAELGLPGVSGSDAHVSREVCSAPILIDGDVSGAEDVLDVIRRGIVRYTRPYMGLSAAAEALWWAVRRRLHGLHGR